VVALLELTDVTKSFGAVRALRGVSLSLHAGEVHALAGENGAGKSTVVRVIGGEHRPDSGELRLDGEAVRFSGPGDAQARGIAVIHQEPAGFPDLTVAENVFVGRHPLRSGRRVDRAGMRRRAAELFVRLGVPMDPDLPMRGLSIADQQIVEIAKALVVRARVIVMDEPTAALSNVEARRLFGVARALAEQGAALLFITHRLDEMFELCQRITVLRDGGLVSSDPVGEVDAGTVVRRMVGRPVEQLYPAGNAAPGDVALRVRGLTTAGVFHDVSFEVRRGEVVGLAGLVGSGRSEVARAVFGVDTPDSGTVELNGRTLRRGDPRAAVAAGLALVPEDRREQGVIPDLSIERNVSLTRLRHVSPRGLTSRARERGLAGRWAERLRLKHGGLGEPVATLSGGNQQKAVLAKWLATEPSVLIVDEPTRGIDVGTKVEVHALLSELASRGVAVLMISSELPEVLGMADRVLVMHEGRITAEIPRAEATEEAVMRAATGRASSGTGSGDTGGGSAA
jgi:rhamnose transport system ATP-binding protein